MGSLGQLRTASLEEVARSIRDGLVSSVEVTQACLDRIDALNATYRAYLTVRHDEALAEARAADQALAKGRPVGPLHGVPVNVKDAFLMTGTETTVASELLRGYAPAHMGHATCVKRLIRAGAIILGKTNVGSGLSAGYLRGERLPPPRNPWAPDRTPGGSSSGAVVSLALGMAYGSVGTDLGGSIRIPAAFSGVVGLKPTFGRTSQYGDVFAMAPALEHVGPLARTVRDAALILSVIAGPDCRDMTTADLPVPDYLARLGQSPRRRLRVGWARDGGPLGAEREVMVCVEKAVAVLAGIGLDVEELSLPAFSEELWHELTTLQEWEAYDSAVDPGDQYLQYIRSRLRLSRARMRARLEDEAARVRDAYGQLLQEYELLVLPTAPIVARPLDSQAILWAGRERSVFDLHLVNTWMFNVTGHPAISVPCERTPAQLPVGLQLVGRTFAEEVVLWAAAAYEEAVGGFRMPDVPSM